MLAVSVTDLLIFLKVEAEISALVCAPVDSEFSPLGTIIKISLWATNIAMIFSVSLLGSVL